jgi:hypothetical protein
MHGLGVERLGLCRDKAASASSTELLDSPEDVPFLSHLIQREIIYRILKTPQGVRLRTIATTGDLGNRTAKAITWLKDNYAKRLHMEELAGAARMGVSTLHHQFRALRDEPASIPKAVEAPEGQGADAYGWVGRHERRLRSRVRERQPIQPRIQLWPASHARCQSSSSEQCRRSMMVSAVLEWYIHPTPIGRGLLRDNRMNTHCGTGQ